MRGQRSPLRQSEETAGREQGCNLHDAARAKGGYLGPRLGIYPACVCIVLGVLGSIYTMGLL